ncbi:MAG: hypothetical protein BroJett039_03100 [Chloroflexota bacterium]|nr:MAG: hypothetical protein BroJett039_03100 [Chloroflexota bacterium]
MAANSTMAFDPDLWAKIAKEASRRRKKPQNFVQEVMREYLEREADFAWWRSIQREYRGTEMSDEQVVEFVKNYRREKRMAANAQLQPHRSKGVTRK